MVVRWLEWEDDDWTTVFIRSLSLYKGTSGGSLACSDLFRASCSLLFPPTLPLP